MLYEQKLPEDGPWILFNAADVLAAAAEVEAYPSEPEWSGFAIRHIRHTMLAASLLLAVGGLASVAETAYRIRDAEAREIFEEMLSRRTHAGLLSEDLSLGDKELWGNYPQTYSLVGIINCAVLLSRSWTDAR